jgi:hypothetical protein
MVLTGLSSLAAQLFGYGLAPLHSFGSPRSSNPMTRDGSVGEMDGWEEALKLAPLVDFCDGVGPRWAVEVKLKLLL